MSLATRIESLVIRVAQEFNDVRATAGNLASLSTTDKSSLVAAINGLKAAVLSATAIDDNQIATSTTYSSNKIVSLLDALKADILGGADAAYDTLVEIQQLLQNGTTGLDALLAAVNLRVRYDAAQTLTVAEQLQARSNIGAVAATAAAGYLDPVEAVRLAAVRGRLMAETPGAGTMLAVVTRRTSSEAAQYDHAVLLADRYDLDVAAVNGPTQVVLSGAVASIEAAHQELASCFHMTVGGL